ncbi:antitoxin VapB [Bryocella elongata]|uniref:Antitoxin VapB n=1 Tax=Bryocella elongata TaxID=863522 RepID=A0A1H6BPL1_9BACT|nr:AbrB/MazE/SpoVT family DNA-binding domain-containing protein [Bryocella elongata]SEG62633.1 antitoxin VapB [Bryocella elongata]
MATQDKAKVFMSGRSQAVRIPARYRFSTDEVFIRQDPTSGDITLSAALPRRPWTALFRALDEAVARNGVLEVPRDDREAAERDSL